MKNFKIYQIYFFLIDLLTKDLDNQKKKKKKKLFESDDYFGNKMHVSIKIL